MKNTRQSAFEKASEFLQSCRLECIADGRERMDTVKELAARAGVGVVSMSQAVSDMCSRGLLFARRGKGIFVPGEGIEEPGAPAHRTSSRAEAVCIAVQNDIINGYLRRGELFPSSKALCERYGVCYHTLGKALDRLVEKGEVERYKKGYRPVAFPSAGTASTLILIASADNEGNLMQHSHRAPELLHTLERECARLSLILEILPANMSLRDHPENVVASVNSIGTENVLGFIMLASGVPEEFLADIATRLRVFERPISLLAGTGEDVFPAPIQSNPGLVTFAPPVSSVIGEKMGNYLLEQGHRRIAFISPMDRYEWSKGRLAGLLKSFREAGYPQGVSAYLKDRDINPTSVVRNPNLPESMQARVAFWRKVTQTKTLRTQVFWGLQREVIQKDMAVLMKKAILDESITAWVGANDNVALECLGFLKKQGLSTLISVVGFDDSLEGAMQGLTSYDFNAYATVCAMISHILQPPRRDPTRHRTVCINGFINERRSTRGRGVAR
jgi:DNA-binding transcriptional regulator YhcF (GntR family)